MNTTRHLVLPAFLLLAASLAAGCTADAAANDAENVAASEDDLVSGRVGAVYTLSNDAASNDVLVFRRAADGSLQRAATYSTTGKGSGDGLGSQGALTLSKDGRWLFAVSAGSNELAVFRARGEVLELADTIATGGIRPVSVTEHDGLVYVAHAGEGVNDVTGFVLGKGGSLRALAGSRRALSGPTVGPAQVSFSPSGRALVVTEKATNLIDELRIDLATGLPQSLTSHPSSGMTPFGFAITQRGQVVVSEAFGGAADASAVSSYQLGASAGLATVSASVPDTESAACWVQLARNDRFAYVTNTASGSVSAYSVLPNGSLSLVGDGRAADTGEGSKPIDMAVSRNDRFLYVLESGTASLGSARIRNDGTLEVLPDVTGLPASAAGLAAQ